MNDDFGCLREYNLCRLKFFSSIVSYNRDQKEVNQMLYESYKS